MARKDLLKKAFRNSFFRKSVADLRSLGAEKAPQKPRHASSTGLHSMYEDAAPILPTPPMSSADFAAEEKVIENEEIAEASVSSLLAVPVAANASRESVTEWLHTVPKDAEEMSSSEIRHEMEKADNEHKAQVLHRHEKLLSDHRDLVLASEEMLIAHIDTIDTAIVLLEILHDFSMHTETLRLDMLEKRQICERNLKDLKSAKIQIGTLKG